MIVIQSGTRLRGVDSGGAPSFWTWPGGAHLNGMLNMVQFADALSQQTDRPVVDQTALTGFYDIKLAWTPGGENPGSDSTPKSGGTPQLPAGARPAARPQTGEEIPSGPTLFTALQEQLGLRLSAQKGPVQILVVDHAEKLPIEN